VEGAIDTVCRPLLDVVTLVCVPPSGTMPGAAPACAAPATRKVSSAAPLVCRRAHDERARPEMTVFTVNPARFVRNCIGLSHRCVRAAFYGDLALGLSLITYCSAIQLRDGGGPRKKHSNAIKGIMQPSM
jgi:hypothetical protein